MSNAENTKYFTEQASAQYVSRVWASTIGRRMRSPIQGELAFVTRSQKKIGLLGDYGMKSIRPDDDKEISHWRHPSTNGVYGIRSTSGKNPAKTLPGDIYSRPEITTDKLNEVSPARQAAVAKLGNTHSGTCALVGANDTTVVLYSPNKDGSVIAPTYVCNMENPEADRKTRLLEGIEARSWLVVHNNTVVKDTTRNPDDNYSHVLDLSIAVIFGWNNDFYNRCHRMIENATDGDWNRFPTGFDFAQMGLYIKKVMAQAVAYDFGLLLTDLPIPGESARVPTTHYAQIAHGLCPMVLGTLRAVID